MCRRCAADILNFLRFGDNEGKKKSAGMPRRVSGSDFFSHPRHGNATPHQINKNYKR